MAISMEVPQIFRKHTNGSRMLRVEGATVREALQRLDRDYPGLKQQLLGDDGELHRFVNVYLNEEDIRYIRHLETPLQEGDRLSILPAVAGGRPLPSVPAVAWGRPAGSGHAHHGQTGAGASV
ncbi:MAG: MoaD/ThiS family protein [candidate division NC10 bacterium]|nr:MoaD/ThiS family protein [candidate division NC10 bacterium]